MLADIVAAVPGLKPRLRATLDRLEEEYQNWREEPLKRVAVRNELLRPWRIRQFHSFGAVTILDRPIWLYGTRLIAIGERVIILRGAWLSVERPVWDRSEPVLTIGNDVAIRTGLTISASDSIIIESDVGIGANVTIIDSRHTWSTGNPNPMHSPVETSPVRIGRGSWVAERATVVAGADIGEQCMIGPSSVVSGTIPDYSVVLGNPGRVVGSTRV
jgi:acetyltransferase-like isoleucine patch superfamily enzyme